MNGEGVLEDKNGESNLFVGSLMKRIKKNSCMKMGMENLKVFLISTFWLIYLENELYTSDKFLYMY